MYKKYVTLTCTRFKHALHFYYSTNKYTGWWHHGSTMMHGIPDPRESLVNDMLSQAIKQANQEDRYSPHIKP